ncbi:thiol:disulfide interchange protein DsbA/DsbL [Rheinheimera aquimaris]|uniref:thiol:disulfide interchange protein DsbA/DsbL n=1 Tax=Rheinheimera aquimaris TaxID=412437 RepID=UPI003A984C04
MKKLLLPLLFVLLTPCLLAQDFNAGEHYDVVSSGVSAPKQVMEFFSYFCPHCYNFEPIAQQLKTSLPADVSFKRAPVSFLGRDMGPELQRAYALAVALNVEHSITPALFARIHTERKAPANRADVRALFAEHGIAPEMFDSRIDSMPVLAEVAGYDSIREKLNITSVPTFVVNGKYVIKIGALKSQQQFNDLVSYLLNLDAQESGNATN